jgi:hypothetical protein
VQPCRRRIQTHRHDSRTIDLLPTPLLKPADGWPMSLPPNSNYKVRLDVSTTTIRCFQWWVGHRFCISQDVHCKHRPHVIESTIGNGGAIVVVMGWRVRVRFWFTHPAHVVSFLVHTSCTSTEQHIWVHLASVVSHVLLRSHDVVRYQEERRADSEAARRLRPGAPGLGTLFLGDIRHDRALSGPNGCSNIL